jgi:hypothetical protein
MTAARSRVAQNAGAAGKTVDHGDVCSWHICDMARPQIDFRFGEEDLKALEKAYGNATKRKRLTR